MRVVALTAKEYLNRVLLKMVGPDRDDRLEDVKMCLPDEDYMSMLRRTQEGFLIDSDTGHAGLLEIYDLSDVKWALGRKKFNTENWHYDRRAGALLVNLRRGVHERLSASLYYAYEGDQDETITPCLAAERFLEEGLGWFRSTSSLGRALKGKDTVLTIQERMAFHDVHFDTM